MVALGCVGSRQGARPQAAPASAARAYPGKLPDGAAPRLYDVHLTIDPNKDRFFGVADVAVDLLEPDDLVVLHGENLVLQDVSVRAGDGRPHAVHVERREDDATLRVHVEPPLPSGVSTLHFVYEAPYAAGLAGIYRTVSDGRAYVFSQFEPLAARRAFPCFDEPRFKAPFQMTLTVPDDAFAASNGLVVAERAEAPGVKTLVFQPTPPLPTYLVALAVGPLDVVDDELGVSPQRAYALPLRGLATYGNGPKLALALRRTGALVQALERYVDLPYPFAKLDIAAVPDFAFGAMENAGLLTFRDWLLLLDGPRPPYSQRRAFESVMAHELTHQWFGDWVTMPWWDDLWLNEAFATWRGQRTAQRTRPGMQFDLELLEGAGNAMDHDGLKSARRVREPCRNKDDVHGAADVITYQKGAAILAMFEHFVGPDSFMQGVRRYLKQFPFATADSTTFLTHVGEGSDAPGLAEAMQTFLDQPGVPEVSFAWRCDEGRQPVLHLSQNRWRPLGSDLDDGSWSVPVCFRYGRAEGPAAASGQAGGRGKGHAGQHSCTVLRETSAELLLHGPCPTWFVANADGAGYYRSRMDDADAGVAAEAAARRGGHATVAELYAGLDNAYASLRSGAVGGAEVLHQLADALQQPNPRLVARALGHLETLRRRYLDAEQQTRARPKLQALLAPLVRRLTAQEARLVAQLARRPAHGSDVDAAEDALGELRVALKEARRLSVVAAGAPALRAQLAHQGAMWLDALEGSRGAPGREASLRAVQGRLGLDADSLELALSVAGEDLGAPFVQRLEEALGHEAGGELRRRLLWALAGLRTPAEAAHVRKLALTGTLHVNEVLPLLQAQLAPGPQQQAAWTDVLGQLDALLPRLSDNDRTRLVASGGWRCTAAAAIELAQAFAPRLPTIDGGARALAQAQETIGQCVAEVEAQGGGVRSFFLTP